MGKKILVVFVGIVIMIGIYKLVSNSRVNTKEDETLENIIEDARRSVPIQHIAKAKEEVQLLASDYANKYTKNNNTYQGLAYYVSKEINGKTTSEGFKIKTNNTNITISKDDILITGVINDKGIVMWE